jgi:plasmid replication initiation protein
MNNIENDKEVLLKNEFIVAKKEFKTFEAKIFYNLLSIFTYEIRQNNNQSRIIEMDTIKVKEIMFNGEKNISFERYYEKLVNMRVMLTLSYDEKLEKSKIISILSFVEPYKDKTIFTLNYDLCEMIKEIGNNFSAIKPLELCKLNSTFSIKAYELCSTYKNLKAKFYHMTIDKFNWFFNVPKSYKSCDVDKRIIKPIIEEINKKTIFKLNIKKHKVRNIITHYDFYISEQKEKIYLEAQITGSVTNSSEVITQVFEEKSEINTILPETKIFELMFNNIKAMDPNFNLSNVDKKKWYNTIALMINKDNRTIEEIEKVINFTQESDFWKSNILTPIDLRNKYTNILVQYKVNNKSSDKVKGTMNKKEIRKLTIPEGMTL